MNRKEIMQLVFDGIGVILVDKAEIHEDSTLEDLALDEDDVNELFSYLEKELDFTFNPFIKERATLAPEHMTLNFLVDLILAARDEKRTKEHSYVEKGNKDRRGPGRHE